MNKKIAMFIILFVAFLGFIYILVSLLPMIVKSVSGNKIIDEHLNEVYTKNVSLNVNIDEAFNWLNGSNIPYGGRNIFPLFLGGGVYKINNKTMLFIKPMTVPWFILIKTGNCGEHAIYLVDIFNRLNYTALPVRAKGGDHGIVGVKYEDDWIFIDPSSKRRIDDANYFENNQWARIIAINNSEEIDLTNDLLKNKSSITIVKNSSQNIKVEILSTYLMKRDDMYKRPILVYEFNLKNQSDFIVVSSGEDYVLESSRNFGVIKFVDKQTANLTKDAEVYVNDVTISMKNIKLTRVGILFIFVGVLIIYLFIIFNKGKKNERGK